jgi:hypothetical protein
VNDPTAGKRLVESGRYGDGMVDSLNVCAYLRQQRTRVRERGECESGCDRTCLVRHFATGRLVCPRTLEPCKSRRLGRIIGLFGKLFERKAGSL